MPGYLTVMDIHNQATAFAVFWRRRGCSQAEAWGAWSGSKDFQAADAQRIRTEAHEILFARGDTTEPPPLAA
jgi:hypothetical protein